MEIQELTQNINTDDPLRVFVYDSGEDTPFTAGFYAMPTALIEASGGINIMNDFKKSWGTVKCEEVIDINPEVIEIVNYGTEKLRVRTKYRGKSLIQRWKDKKARKTLKKFANRLYKGSYTDSLFHAYRSAIALSWGTLSSMRTSAALQMYRKYNAKKVLDFTAGWGSRMTAALAADIDYIGIDSNKSLKKGYNKIIKAI